MLLYPSKVDIAMQCRVNLNNYFHCKGGVADFMDGYDPSINVASCSDEKDEDESFKHYGELVPAGMYGWGG